MTETDIMSRLLFSRDVKLMALISVEYTFSPLCPCRHDQHDDFVEIKISPARKRGQKIRI